MQFLHKRLYLGDGEHVLVAVDVQANVLLTDDSNFNRYKNSQPYQYYGGLAKQSPVRLTPIVCASGSQIQFMHTPKILPRQSNRRSRLSRVFS
jgi:hypothetical protein